MGVEGVSREMRIFFVLLGESMRDAASILCTCFGGDLICNCWETWWARSSNLEWNLIFLFFTKLSHGTNYIRTHSSSKLGHV